MNNPAKNQEITDFRLNSFDLSYPKAYQTIMREVFVFDVYRSYLLRKGDLVLDVGATIGEFSILASKKVGDTGKVVSIEPNVNDFRLLELNIKKNNCSNIIPINMGVAKEHGTREMSFHGKAFNCIMDTLDNILHSRGIRNIFNFIKIDIEGYELDLLNRSIDTIGNANVISIELHGTKKEVDEILTPFGFTFRPVTASYCVGRTIKNLGFHPRPLIAILRSILANNPGLAYKLLTGYKMHNNKLDLIMGSYVKDR